MPYKDRETQLEAQRTLQRAHYQKNKAYYKKRKQELHQRAREYIWKVRVESVCCQCGEDHPACLQFHHRDTSQKRFSIGESTSKDYGVDTIAAEIAKCDVLCANCHFKLHWNENNA